MKRNQSDKFFNKQAADQEMQERIQAVQNYQMQSSNATTNEEQKGAASGSQTSTINNIVPQSVPVTHRQGKRGRIAEPISQITARLHAEIAELEQEIEDSNDTEEKKRLRAQISSKKTRLNKRLREDVKDNEHLDVILSFMPEKEHLFNSIKSSFFQYLNDADGVQKLEEAGQF